MWFTLNQKLNHFLFEYFYETASLERQKIGLTMSEI